MNISFKWKAKQISGLVSKVIFTGTHPCDRTIKVIDTRTGCRFSLMLHAPVEYLIIVNYLLPRITNSISITSEIKFAAYGKMQFTSVLYNIEIF